MNRRLFEVVLLGICFVSSRSVWADRVEKWKWDAKFPQQYAEASSYAVHKATFDWNKSYRFSHTGRISDLYQEIGRPDRYSRQPFYSDKFAEHRTPKTTMPGTFLYTFHDGTKLFVPATSGGIIFVVAYSIGHQPRILYK